MSPRDTARLAWSLAGLSLVMFVASVALFVLVRSLRGGADVWSIAGDLWGYGPLLAFSVVGALVASRRPRNPIGWILSVAGLLWMILGLVEDYATYGLAEPGSVPFPVTINALGAWLWVPAVGLIGTYLILLFPDGKLPSPGWRPLAWLSGAVIAAESAATFLIPGPLDGLGGARNPFGLEGQPWVEALALVVLPLLPLCMVASAASLVLRFRRSGGVVREQIKWIALSASVMGLVYLTLMSTGLIVWLLSVPGTDLSSRSLWGALLGAAMLLSFVAMPVTIGFAVLKYRLFDIDVVINRTLVYGALTVSLALTYFGSVVVLQRAFVFLTGEGSQLTIVASTLAIAALFVPLRRRIQGFIDRRFYRNKYDARKTLEEFGARLRDETNLETLGDDMVSVVRETVQPAHVGLWLRHAYEGIESKELERTS